MLFWIWDFGFGIWKLELNQGDEQTGAGTKNQAVLAGGDPFSGKSAQKLPR